MALSAGRFLSGLESTYLLKNIAVTFFIPHAFVHHHKERHNLARFLGVVRANNRRPNKHWDHLWSRPRGRKFIKVDLPDFDKMHQRDEMSVEELRSEMKRRGMPPTRPWRERPIHVSSSEDIFDVYVPPEGDGKMSFLSREGLKQLQKKYFTWKTRASLKKIKERLPDYTEDAFLDEAERVFLDAHAALAQRDENRLHELVTEKAFIDMWAEQKLRTVRWELVERLEASRVVHVRTESAIDKENLYAQITVRMHTKQKLAVYDQFGRLMLGSEDTPRDVLEYVVFENHIANQYGSWRIHGKIHPNWLPPKQPIRRTFRKPNVGEERPDSGGYVGKYVKDEEGQLQEKQ